MSDDKNLTKRSFKAASWVLVLQFSTQFVQIFLGICMARLLCPEDYGILGMLAIFWGISQCFINGGFTDALLQKKEVTTEDACSVFYYNIFLSLFFCFGMIAAAPWIADFYHQPILRHTILVSAWALPIGALASVQKVMLGRELKQGFITASQSLGIVVSGLTALFLAWHGYGVWALVWQYFIATACGTISIFFFARWIPRWIFSFRALSSLFKFGSKLLLAGLLNQIFNNINNLVIGKFYSAQTLGYFEQARRYSTIWPFSIQGAIAQVLFPAFSKIQDDLPRLRNAFARSLNLSAFTIIFPPFLLCVLSYPFMTQILSQKWVPCIPYLWLLTCSVIFYPLHVLNLQILNALGRSDLFLRLEIIKKCLATFSIAILILWGIVPMLVAGIFSSCLCAYLNSYYVGKMTGWTFFHQMKSISPYVLLSVISCMTAWLCYRMIYPFSPWGGLLIPAFAGFFCYVLLNRLFRTAAFFELLSLLGGKFPWLTSLLCCQSNNQH